VNIFLIGGLLLACVILFKRSHDLRTENSVLRDRVASLKRQLARLR
jgi:hypothetical protein